MKIAILTLPLHTNFGGVLQAYALQTVLEKMGHTVDVLQRTGVNYHSHSSWLIPIVYAKRYVQRLLGNKQIEIFSERRRRREQPILSRNVSRFINQYIHIRPIRKFSEISREDYDAIVVGSDQIWRKCYFNYSWLAPISNAFLDFTDNWNIKRISYAASFGMDNVNEYTEKDIHECRTAIQRFDAVSVREDSGVKICKDFFGVDAKHLVDPTMLLDKDDYEALVNQSDVPKSEGDMMCYILDSNPFKDKVISFVAELKGLHPFKVNADVDNLSIPVEQRVQPPIETWLRGFMDAKFVVTDSFHACVFSIIFGKPFIAIGNAGRGMSRFTSLLRTFGLEDRLIFESDDISKLSISDLNLISDLTLLKEKRGTAIQFLSQL